MNQKPTCFKLLFAWWVVCLWCCCNSSMAQLMCREVRDISQATNEFIYRSTADQVFISSLDGLNIYDGLHTKVYRSATHHFYGTNIQSPFFEDTTGRVWFCTYEALHYYDPGTDNFEYYFMVSVEGDTIRDNYKVFYLDGNDLYLKAGTAVFVFDIQQKRIKHIVPLNLSEVSNLRCTPHKQGKVLTTISPGTVSIYELNAAAGFRLIHQEKMNATAMELIGNQVLFGTTEGSIHAIAIDPISSRKIYTLPPVAISDLCRLNDSILLISNFSDTLYYFNLPTRSVMLKSNLVTADKYNAPISTVSELYVDKDSILWIDVDNGNVYTHNLKGKKFNHWLKGYDITHITPYKQGQMLVHARLSGIALVNSLGKLIRQWNDLPGIRKNFSSSSGAWEAEDNWLFVAYDILFKLNLETGQITKPVMVGLPKQELSYIKRISNGLLIACNEDSLLYSVVVVRDTAFFDTYVNLSGRANTALRFYEDKSANLYVSNDDKNILVLKPEVAGKSHRYWHTMDIQGGIKWVHDEGSGSPVYVATTEGVTTFNLQNQAISPLLDKDKLLSGTIYAIVPDEQGVLWMSSNHGLIAYHPESNEARSFSILDGLQGNEFNTNVCYQVPDGSMVFGGRNGLNFFHPQRMRINQKPAPVIINEVRINDEIDSAFAAPQLIHTYALPFVQNTISFNFHAVDFGDPSSARVKYQLIGVDPAYVETGSPEGSIRYANLPPGKYTLSIMGRNADGVWNSDPQEIAIIINAPFWRTWWFITLAVITLLAIGYMILRNYFRQKLRKQAIIIEKQQAVEQERTRIAAEMHDDLGAGLTTIRYLSDKALKQASNPEEVAQIRRIADQSNALVRNMSEIIWAMNSRFDTAESLVAYLRRYVMEYLQERQIPVQFIAGDLSDAHIPITGEKRRNIFLVVKELLHNSVKYANASAIRIEVSMNGAFALTLSEIGAAGFDPTLLAEKGNGLYNCKRRMQSIGGEITFEKTAESMDITLAVPLAS